MNLTISRQGITWVYAVKGPPITLGRGADNTIVLEDAEVSRHHARIEWTNSQPYLVDLGSANGTQINGATVPADTPHPIERGDHVLIGDFQLSPSLPQVAQGQGDPSSRPFPDDKAAVLIGGSALGSFPSELPPQCLEGVCHAKPVTPVLSRK